MERRPRLGTCLLLLVLFAGTAAAQAEVYLTLNEALDTLIPLPQ